MKREIPVSKTETRAARAKRGKSSLTQSMKTLMDCAEFPRERGHQTASEDSVRCPADSADNGQTTRRTRRTQRTRRTRRGHGRTRRTRRGHGRTRRAPAVARDRLASDSGSASHPSPPATEQTLPTSLFRLHLYRCFLTVTNTLTVRGHSTAIYREERA